MLTELIFYSRRSASMGSSCGGFAGRIESSGDAAEGDD